MQYRHRKRLMLFSQGLSIAAIFSVLWLGTAHAGEQACALKKGPIKTVTRINDADSITLEDGSEVKLAGTLAPRASDGNAASGKWPVETGAISALSAIILGQKVELAFGATRTDRYGRHVAHLFVGRGRDRIWVQGALLSSGFARAYAIPGGRDCLPELLAHEKIARNSRLGLWSVGLYRPKPADRTALLMYLRSSFQIVAGRAANVSRTKSGIYLNFGTNWRDDFTIHIPKDVASENRDWETTLDSLKGKNIEVRGWIERRNGPMITLSHPAQIEIIPEGMAARAFLKPRTRAKDIRTPQEEAPDANEPPAQKEERPEPAAPGAFDL